MSAPRRDSKWWGWGDPAVAPELDTEALGVLRERLGELEPWPLAAELDDFVLLNPQPLAAALIEAVGEENVFGSHEDRLRHAGGSGYADLARMRLGHLEGAPDAVLMPPDAGALRRILDVCLDAGGSTLTTTSAVTTAGSSAAGFVHSLNFSTIHASCATGESLRPYASVCGRVDWICR